MRRLFKLLAGWALATLTSVALPHWPDQAPHQMAELGEFQFEGGGSIKNLKMSYVTHGKLNAVKDNAILFMHGFALNHHQLDHLIGPGKPFDTDKYFIICTDELGSSQTTFKHSTSPTNSGLKMAFPAYNGRDKVRAEYELVTRTLDIPHLLVVTGYSSGADHSVQFAVSYPNFMDGVLPLGGGAMWGTQGFFYGPLMISALETCANWNGGNYEQNLQQCATNALSWLIPYFYTREWWDQYVDTPEAYQKWRSHWGDYYLDIQDARDLYYRVMAEGRGWLGDTPGFDSLEAALGSIKAKVLFIYNPRDQFYLPHHIEAQVKATPKARATTVDSIAGHLMCCNADPQATWTLGEAIRGFLREISAKRNAKK
jgi:homoserine O-acetyltransferase/O-succinyltransferase